MSAPTFEDGSPEMSCKLTELPEDPDHDRPLSATLDVRDEIMDKLLKLFLKKPIWSRDELFQSSSLKQYDSTTLSYIIQNAIESGFELKDSNGRIGHLEAKENVFAFGVGKNDTLVERLVNRDTGTAVPLPETPDEEIVTTQDVALSGFRDKIDSFILDKFPSDVIDWYIADTLLSNEERIKYILSLDWLRLPIFAKPLKLTDNLIVLGFW
jgi:hypothetical protein